MPVGLDYDLFFAEKLSALNSLYSVSSGQQIVDCKLPFFAHLHQNVDTFLILQV